MYGEWFHLGIVIFTFCVTVVTACIHLLAWFPNAVTGVLYKSDRTAIWRLRGVSFLDAEWLKWLWLAVYIYQLMICIFMTTIVCRPRDTSKALRHIIHPTGLLTYILGLIATLGWSLLVDRSSGHAHYFTGLAGLGAYILVHVAFSVFVSTFTVVKAVLLRQARCDVFLVRLLIYNGTSGLATYLLIMVLYQVAQILAEYSVLTLDTIQYIWLGVVTGYIFLFFLVDVAATQYALEYTFAPFLIGILVLGSILTNDAKQPEASGGRRLTEAMTFVVAALMAFMGLLFFITLGVAVEKGKKYDQPMLKRHYDTPLKVSNLDVPIKPRVNKLTMDKGTVRNYLPAVTTGEDSTYKKVTYK